MTSITPAEIARFDALAERWWDPDGPMRPLHRMNRLRTGWIGARIARAFGTRAVRLLDVGCGAGLASEVFARAGHDVVGLDAAAEALGAARAHAAGLAIDYRLGAAEDLVAAGETFEVVTALEVIEHVADPRRFVADLARLLRPGGLLFVTTLNRTPRSLVTAKFGAEYVLRWLPMGTHDWRRFVTPAELGGMCRRAGLAMQESAGMTLNLLGGQWRISRDLGVNYIAVARRP